MNECLKVLKTRRSVKRFKPDPVPENLLSEILEAGKNAPTGMNYQSPVMVAVTNPETINEISNLLKKVRGTDKEPLYNAPCVIVVLADSDMFTYTHDGSLVMGNLLNAAHSLGLGACWIHRAKEAFETEEGKKLMKKWGLKESFVGIGNCILGYPDIIPEEKVHKDDYIIYDK